MGHDLKISGGAGGAPESAEAGSAAEAGSDRRLARLAAIDPRVELLSLPGGGLEAALGEWLAARGEPVFRVGQIVRAIYQEHAPDWDALTTIAKPLRAALAADFRFPSLALGEVRASADGTQKYLWQLLDGEAIESVLIPTPHRDTICLSSQAGCALACTFCATGLFGYRRNLTVGEIVDQARQLIGRRPPAEHGVNVVFMGMGEPLLNWDNLRGALDLLISARYLNIGARRITVSTVGVPARIVALGEAYPQVRLAVSLHAARDAVRDTIVPLNKRYPLRELFAACRLWVEATGKHLSFEYLHLPGVNDRPDDIAALAAALAGLPAKVNLMRYNPIPGAPYRRPEVHETVAFRDALRRAMPATTVTVRRSRGLDIEGACGQLRLARAGAQLADAQLADAP